jgi:hypothetical protein
MKIKGLLQTVIFFGLIICNSQARSNSAKGPGVKLTILNSMERIAPTDVLFGTYTADLYAAKNEVESFQVVVHPLNKNIKVVNAELSELKGSGGVISKQSFTLYREEYVRIRRSSSSAKLPPGLYADPLIPFINPETGKPIQPVQYKAQKFTGYDMFALPFDVWQGQNQPIWIDVHVPANVAAGDYKGSFTITLDNSEVFSIPVTLTVWDFALPDITTHRTHFGYLDEQELERFFGVSKDSEKFKEIQLRYCEMMAEHRVNPPLPPFYMPAVNNDGSLNIISERHKNLKKFIEELHVGDFEVPLYPGLLRGQSTGKASLELIQRDKEKIFRYFKDYYEYLANNGWEKRAYVYTADEPNTREDYQYIAEIGKILHAAAPGIKCLSVEQPWPQNNEWPDIDPATDVWCPITAYIDREAIDKKLEEGDEVWSYTALVQRAGPDVPHYNEVKTFNPPYWLIDEPLAAYRVETWINWQYKITGFLYWTTVYTAINVPLKPMENPWYNPGFPLWPYINGDGFLFYPGTPCGMNGPIGTLRMKNIRESMEDYEYFSILEKKAGREKVSRLVSEVTSDWGHWSREPAKYYSARKKIAALILKYKNEIR